MNPRIGTWIRQTISAELFSAYVPKPLPPDPPLDLARLYPHLEKATLALAELNSVTQSIPNTALFIYMYVRKEALLSSQIEGTQSSFSDLILFENDQAPHVSIDDVTEVSNYIKAITFGLMRVRNGFPLSLRLLREIHGILLSGSRGAQKSPGEFRRSQNWIGGTRPGNALFVPPPVDHLEQCLFDFESFLHNDKFPTLIKAGLAHVQFETIHPFLDGNGRLGRLLVTLVLCSEGLIAEPVLYLSLYLKQQRKTYYDLLQEVRERGTWETWLEFFLLGIAKTAKQAVATTYAINQLFAADEAKVQTLGRLRFSAKEIFDYLKLLPEVSVSLIASKLPFSAPTARTVLNQLVALGIIEETTEKKRDKVYLYRRSLALLEDGTEPL